MPSHICSSVFYRLFAFFFLTLPTELYITPDLKDSCMKHSSLLYIGALLVSMALASCSEKDKPSVSSARNENKTPAPEAVENPADVRANESQSAFHLPALLMPGPLEPVPLDITDSTAQVPMLAVANIGRFASISQLRKSYFYKQFCSLYPELEKQLTVLWPEVYDFITDDDRPTQNVTEWCKRKECWEQAKKRKWTILPEFLDTLIAKETLKAAEKDAKADQKVKNEVDDFKFVWSAGKTYWQKVLDWGNDRKLLYHAEQDILKMCVDMYDSAHTPTDKQVKVAMKAREKLIKEGMPLDL